MLVVSCYNETWKQDLVPRSASKGLAELDLDRDNVCS
jgi:hypothetical protein